MFFSNPKKDIFGTLTLYAVLLGLSFLIGLATGILNVNDTQKVYSQVIEIKSNAPFLLAYLLVVRVIAEEVFFRGFLAKQLGAGVSSVVFGLAHVFYGSVTEIIGAVVLGYVLAKAFEANKSLVPNIGAHFLYNLTIVLII